MTLDPQIRDRLQAAVDQDQSPPGFAEAMVRRGRRRRARRYGVAGLAAAVVIAATSAAVLLPGTPEKKNADTAGTHGPTLAWARSLSEGPAPDLPYFVEGGVHDGGQVVPVPDDVIGLTAARVEGGWLVRVSLSEELGLAVLAPDGSLRELPPWRYSERSNDASVVVSRDGTQVAYGDRVLELDTREVTLIPHENDEEVHLVGFVEDGLVYNLLHGENDGTTRLLTSEGSALEIDPPSGAHVWPGKPADIALTYPMSEGECLASYVLVDAEWVERKPDCGDRSPGQAFGVSPDGRWVLTTDLPQVWDLENGGFREVEVPRGRTRDETGMLLFWAAWESPDTFVVPVTDGMVNDEDFVDREVDSAVQVVRCTMSTGDCERAGEELVLGPDSAIQFARDYL